MQIRQWPRRPIPTGKKVKEVDLYSAFIVVPHTQGAQVQITQCYLQIGTSPDCGCGHLIAAQKDERLSWPGIFTQNILKLA